MSEAQQVLQNLDERIDARAQAIRAEREWWPCRRGCDHCCRHLAHPPELTSMEWERIDAAVALLPTPVQATIAQKVHVLLQQIVEQTDNSPVVCPYLDEQEGACHIYEARPTTCRTYGFFVTRHYNQYCHYIETEINARADKAIVWGNAEAIRRDIQQISGVPIPFEIHYRDRL